MPVIRIGPNIPHHIPELVSRIVEELKRDTAGDAGSNVDAPLIIEETVNRGPLFHVLVIWDKWKEVAMEDRGATIMEAYEQVHGREVTSKISLVMGLTREQADRLKLAPEGLAAANG